MIHAQVTHNGQGATVEVEGIYITDDAIRAAAYNLYGWPIDRIHVLWVRPGAYLDAIAGEGVEK